MKILLLYLAGINLLSFLLMAIDKGKARRQTRRIPERTLLMLCAIGGSVGGLMGLFLLRHKTLHKRFAIGIPALFLLHCGLIYLYWSYLL